MKNLKPKKADSSEADRELTKPYEPTPRELKALSSQESRWQSRSPAPRMKIVPLDGDVAVKVDHADNDVGFRLLMEGFSTSNVDFASAIIAQLGEIDRRDGQINEQQFNAALALARGIKPQDELETMLAAQMAAVHNATMAMACRLARSENTMQRESAERAFNKLARTFAAQVDTLKRYRSKGEQKVTVKHVTVNEGGQAIVGAVRSGRGE